MNELGIIFMLLKFVPPIAFLLLAGLWLFSVIRHRVRTRLVLLLTGCAVFLLAGILFGGEWLLGEYGLAWRQWVKMVFALPLWCAGLAVSILTVCWIPRSVANAGKGVRACLRGLAVLCMVVAMWFGTIWGGFWIGPESEAVVTYHGVKAVQMESHWLDEYIAIYEYHTPFTRGDRPIGPIGG